MPDTAKALVQCPVCRKAFWVQTPDDGHQVVLKLTIPEHEYWGVRCDSSGKQAKAWVDRSR